MLGEGNANPDFKDLTRVHSLVHVSQANRCLGQGGWGGWGGWGGQGKDRLPGGEILELALQEEPMATKLLIIGTSQVCSEVFYECRGHAGNPGLVNFLKLPK